MAQAAANQWSQSYSQQQFTYQSQDQSSAATYNQNYGYGGYQQSFHSHHYPQTQEEVRTLWVGDLLYWMDDSYLHSLFAHTGEVVSVKIIRNKQTGYPEGYGFIEFISHGAAEKILQTYNGTQMPQTEQNFRLNWASFGMRMDGGPDHSIFVGDLSPDVTDYMLQETFRSRYQSVRGAKVVIDVTTGRSKGYGFVRFADENERSRAMTEMNGVYCSTRPMRISAATPKKGLAVVQPVTKVSDAAAYQTPSYGSPTSQGIANDNDPNNTTIFVGGLDANVTEDDLRQLFGQFGELIYVKIPLGKGCGFVQFTHRQCAEEAISKLHGYVIGQQSIRLSWGRSPANKMFTGAWGQTQSDVSQWGAGYYGYGQGYDGYGYATQDPAYGYNYAGYGYNQQMDMSSMVAPVAMPIVEQKEEVFDPLAPVDIEKLNVAYIETHEARLVGRPFWLKCAEQSQDQLQYA